MTLRSPSRGEYWKRMAFVALLALAVYAIVISEKGGGGTFRVWRPERMRFLLIALIAVGAAAYEFRPGGAVPSETKHVRHFFVPPKSRWLIKPAASLRSVMVTFSPLIIT